MRTFRVAAACAALLVIVTGASGGQQPSASAATNSPAVANAPDSPEYTIGPGDVLNVNFWREPEMSGEVVVRPDGKITIPLIKEVSAVGLTPNQLEAEIQARAERFVQEASATVTVRTINSRMVYITGNVARPGGYALNGPTSVLQFIAQVGGVLEYSDSKNIVIMRTRGGKSETFKFNYKDIVKQKNLAQNIELRPGDTVIVP